MATINDNKLTLIDWARRRDPDGNTDMIVEALSENNPILQDAAVLESNLPTGHRTTIRTALPTAQWRQLNAGVPITKSHTRQTTDAIGQLETYSEVDKSLADLSGDTTAFRLSEDRAHISSMGIEAARAIFYGNDDGATPEEPRGFQPRYETLSSSQLIDGGGDSDGDQASMWFITWGADTAHLIFPKGQMAGLQVSDKGQITKTTASSTVPETAQYEAYRTHFKWDLGVVVRDERFVVRIANIDTTNLIAGTDPDFPLLMIQAYNAIEQVRKGSTVIYCNRTVKTWLDYQRQEKTNLALSLMDWAGEETLAFWGLPIRTCDALLNTENEVT